MRNKEVTCMQGSYSRQRVTWNKVLRRMNVGSNKTFVPGGREAHGEPGSAGRPSRAEEEQSLWSSDTGSRVRNYRESPQSIKQWAPHLTSKVYSEK